MPDVANIGFIGCGGNARGHMRRVRENPGARVVAVCDVVEEAARRAAADSGAEPYTDLRRLLDRTDLHAVYLSLPVFAHGEPELAVIERGLPFLVEKPVAIDMATAREIEARVAASGLTTAVGYQLRYGATVDAARQELAGKRIGLVNGRYWCDTGTGSPDHWLRQMARSGGQLVEQATHTVDMMRCLAGEVTEVFCAWTSQVLHHIDCPDFNAVALRFAGGAVGSLTTSWAFRQGWEHTNAIDILYEGSLMSWSLGRLCLYREGQVEERALPAAGIDDVFIEAVRTGDASRIRSPYADAARTLAVTLAMNRSAVEGRPVRVEEMG